MKKLTVIHPSVIVRQGIADVIKSYFNTDVLRFQAVTEFIENVPRVSSLVVLTYPLQTEDMNRILNLKQSQFLTIICLKWPETEAFDSLMYDHDISLWASKNDFYNLLFPLLAQQDSVSGEKYKDELTARETDVVRNIALGLTNKEMAERLNISIHTVISHRKNITSKLGIKSISGITVYAMLNKLVDTDTIDPETLI